MVVENLWNDNERGKIKGLFRCLSQCHILTTVATDALNTTMVVVVIVINITIFIISNVSSINFTL
jgi:hypothetical protein